MANNTSQHILSTSANLLGFCLIVITSFHVVNRSVTSIIDEFTSAVAMLFVFSCFFSFLSILTQPIKREQWLEKIANYLFLTGLLGVLMIILLIVFNIVK